MIYINTQPKSHIIHLNIFAVVVVVCRRRLCVLLLLFCFIIKILKIMCFCRQCIHNSFAQYFVIHFLKRCIFYVKFYFIITWNDIMVLKIMQNALFLSITIFWFAFVVCECILCSVAVSSVVWLWHKRSFYFILTMTKNNWIGFTVF